MLKFNCGDSRTALCFYYKLLNSTFISEIERPCKNNNKKEYVMSLFILLLISIWVASSLEILQIALPDTILCMSFGDHLCTLLLAHT